MRKTLILILFLFFIPVLANADPSNEVYRALKKIEAKCQIGIAYKDYAPALGDAKLELNLFLDSNKATEKPEFTQLIVDVMKNYQDAQVVWSMKFSDGRPRNYILSKELNYEVLLYRYPDSKKPIRDGGILKEEYDPETCAMLTRGPDLGIPKPNCCYDNGTFKLDLDELINFIWRKNSERLKLAAKFI